MIKQFLFIILIICCTQLSAAEQNKVKFKKADEVIQALKADAKTTVQGPFELKIVAMSKAGFNTRLHTKKESKDPENIIIELSPFMAQYYTKQFDTTLEQFFMNQVLAVNGKVTPIQITENEQTRTEYVIKVFLANQLAHLQ